MNLADIIPLHSPMHPVWERGVRIKGSNMDISIMTKNMLDFKEAMDNAQIPFIFIFGTLLGVIRDKNFIPYDNDADVACDAINHRKICQVVKELKAKGFIIPEKNEIPLHDHFFIRDGEKIDIWWFDEIDDYWIYDKHIRYKKSFFQNPKEISFLNKQFLIPNNPLVFLDSTYGPSWIEPIHINDPKSDYVIDMTLPGGRKR